MKLRPMISLLAALSLFSIPALAAPPDAGTLLNEQRQPGGQLPDRLPAPDKSAVEPPRQTGNGEKITVKAFRFTGFAEIATEAELQELVQGDVGTQLGIADLQAVAARVTHYLRENKGYLLPRAYLPKQDVTAGTIEIAIVAGRIDGKVKVNRAQPARISQTVLEEIAEHAVPEASMLRMERIERATMLMNDLPGIEVKSSLEPGSTPGTARVIIDASEGSLFNGYVSTDNTGDRYTGTWRGTGQLNVMDPYGLGDQLSFSLTGAEQMIQGRFSYSLPLGTSGLTGTLSYTGLYYELGGDLKNLDASGRADTLSAGISYPFMRTRTASIWGGANFEYQMLTDEANGAKTNDRSIPVGSSSISGSFQDSFAGGGLTNANVSLYAGDIDLSAVAAAQAADDAGPKTSGGFWRNTYSVSRLQRLTQQLTCMASAKGQFTTNNLDSSQKFILGGSSGVRAYPTGEASGDEGHAFTLETRYDVPGSPAWATTQLIGFVDTGWVKLHHDSWPGAITNISGTNDYWLSGGGAGLNIGKAGLYNIKATWAHTIGTNDGRSSIGKDADNRSDNNRFWLTAMVWF